jgi:hypothetical protein
MFHLTISSGGVAKGFLTAELVLVFQLIRPGSY